MLIRIVIMSRTMRFMLLIIIVTNSTNTHVQIHSATDIENNNMKTTKNVCVNSSNSKTDNLNVTRGRKVRKANHNDESQV